MGDYNAKLGTNLKKSGMTVWDRFAQVKVQTKTEYVLSFAENNGLQVVNTFTKKDG